MKIAEAVEVYGIARTTLRDRLKGAKSWRAAAAHRQVGECLELDQFRIFEPLFEGGIVAFFF